MAKGELRDGLGHVSLVYLKPEARGRGGGNELVRDLVAHFREQGLEHVSLNVELPNDEALAYWRRLGFTDYRRSLLTDLDSLERRLAGGEVASTGSIHLQTDDLERGREGRRPLGPARRPLGVERRRRRRGTDGSASTTTSPPAQPEQLRRLASELSYVSGGVVVALGVGARRGRSARRLRPGPGGGRVPLRARVLRRRCRPETRSRCGRTRRCSAA